MQKQRWGRIVSVMSMSVKEPLDGLILSNGVRPAVVGMAKTLSREVGQYNITVNTVLPGRILTDRLTGALAIRAGKGRLSPWNKPWRRAGKMCRLAGLVSR